MELLAHRGFWRTPAEKNAEAAFRRAFDAGYGIETDVRDRLGELVVSHDPATGGEMTLAAFLALSPAIFAQGGFSLEQKPLDYALRRLLRHTARRALIRIAIGVDRFAEKPRALIVHLRRRQQIVRLALMLQHQQCHDITGGARVFRDVDFFRQVFSLSFFLFVCFRFISKPL